MSKSEEKMFKKLVESMGITSYDPLLLSALGEYSRRLTTEIICDAMDVAEHEQRKDDITADDLKTAIKISGVHLHSQRAEAESVLAELQRVVNAQSVLQEADKDAVLSPYPRSHYDSLSQRCFTYVPGSTAYPPQSQRSHQQQEATDLLGTTVGAKESKPISLQIKSTSKSSRPAIKQPVDEES